MIKRGLMMIVSSGFYSWCHFSFQLYEELFVLSGYIANLHAVNPWNPRLVITFVSFLSLWVYPFTLFLSVHNMEIFVTSLCHVEPALLEFGNYLVRYRNKRVFGLCVWLFDGFGQTLPSKRFCWPLRFKTLVSVLCHVTWFDSVDWLYD